MSAEHKIEDCPLANPACPFITTITENRTNIKWLKEATERQNKLLWARVGIDIVTVLSIVGFMLKVAGVL